MTCYCGKPFAGRPMVECSKCLTWVHLKCAGLRRTNIPDTWHCKTCKPTLKVFYITHFHLQRHKVQIFWESHKIGKKIPNHFDHLFRHFEKMGAFFKFCGPLNIWTLNKKAIRKLAICVFPTLFFSCIHYSTNLLYVNIVNVITKCLKFLKQVILFNFGLG